VYLSDDAEDDFVDDEVSEYEDFEGDDDNVSSSATFQSSAYARW
jgi:hypothetical protein